MCVRNKSVNFHCGVREARTCKFPVQAARMHRCEIVSKFGRAVHQPDARAGVGLSKV